MFLSVSVWVKTKCSEDIGTVYTATHLCTVRCQSQDIEVRIVKRSDMETRNA